MFSNKRQLFLIGSLGIFTLAGFVMRDIVQLAVSGTLLLILGLIYLKLRLFYQLLIKLFWLFPSISFLHILGASLDLYKNLAPFDEILHLYSGFILGLLIAYFLLNSYLKDIKHDRLLVILLILGLVVTIGVGWETFEWLVTKYLGISLMEGIDDTMTDLILDGLGGLIAIVFVVRDPDLEFKS